MGVVWGGLDEVLHRPVAVKEVVPPNGVDDADYAELRARTLREARAAARISAPGVVAIYDVVEEDGRPLIVMERLPHHTLEDELAERGPLPAAEVALIGSTLLAGLMAAHDAGVLHRDVKPSNVMFRERPDGRRAVLADFGIAHLDGDARITATGQMVGSPAYLAPERARGEPATAASDLWSLGVTLWTAVEGRSPFLRANSLASLTAVITEDVPRPVRAGALTPALDGLLRKDPAERIDAATARRLLADALPRVERPTERLSVAAPASAPVADRPAPAPVTPAVTPSATVPARVTPPATAPARVTSSATPPPSAPVARPVPATAPAAETSPPSPAPPWWSPGPAGGDERPVRRRGRRLPALVAALVALVAIGAAVLQPFGDGDRDPADAGGQASAPAAEPEAEAPAGETDQTEGTAPLDTQADPGADEAAADPGAGGADPAAPEDAGAQGSGGDGQDAADSGSTGAQGTDAPTADQPPAGFEQHVDPTGFSIAVPAGWQAERDGPRVYFHDPASRAYLLVDQTDDPKPDPVADWQQQEPGVADRLENYARIGEIQATDFRGWQAADWEFVFGPGQGTHVLNRNVVTGPDRAYALYWSVPSSQWDAMLPVHEQVVGSFQPAG